MLSLKVNELCQGQLQDILDLFNQSVMCNIFEELCPPPSLVSYPEQIKFNEFLQMKAIN